MTEKQCPKCKNIFSEQVPSWPKNVRIVMRLLISGADTKEFPAEVCPSTIIIVTRAVGDCVLTGGIQTNGNVPLVVAIARVFPP